ARRALRAAGATAIYRRSCGRAVRAVARCDQRGRRTRAINRGNVMSKRWQIVGYVALALVIVVSVVAWRFLAAAGYFTGIRQEIAADCRAIPAVPGPEDIVIDRERGIAYVSAYDRRAVQAG